MSLDATLFAQLVVFIFILLVGLPLLALPWLIVIRLCLKWFGKNKDKENNNG